ncbi:DNA protecting protein DprA [Candidatus Roizmanbacteria bacterium RIFCSPHIGHO2_01_FULL_39_12b]|uniref:DNA protecting protein DprA n=1 Tax=Candidatus Roizmanbacteria bacterium RIFCSPHIGHO2_01_FULL_39_12b TaxID=1802030 RepID=A0A1F7GAM0_9BACT|nr:MAG: DNA protecting protein DprA [Candidatus Roizmanbacteria bacterium RIFCSPHIGHO2_01_FULL_39_12b]
MDALSATHFLFSYFRKIPPLKFSEIIEELSHPEELLSAGDNVLKKYIRNPLLDEFLSFRKSYSIEEKLYSLKQKQINYVPKNSPQFPPQLSICPDCPIGLFVKGNVSLLTQNKLFIAIVGTRHPTPYGKMLTTSFIDDFPSDRTVVVSGMALGIDGLAHFEALKNKIPTIAVLACGVDRPYPSSHRSLYEKIITSGGAIVSEMPPGTELFPSSFLERNRIVAGLSSAVIVIEGSSRSGTLSTARWAAEYDRPVFAPPHPITSRGAPAPHQLLKQGANLITNSSDIFMYFNLPVKDNNVPESVFTSNQNILLESLKEHDRLSVDEILMATKISPSILFSTLSELELLGVIAKAPDGTYYQSTS